MKRILVLDDYQDVALRCADWSQFEPRAAVETVNRYLGDEKERVDVLRDFEIVVAMRERTPFTRSLLSQLPKLELLVSTGPVNASIDSEAAREMGIAVTGTRGFLPPTMELTWALILACAKRVPPSDRDLKQGRWQQRMGIDLAGTRVGIVGLGVFGSRVARVAKAFDMDVVAWSENLTEERCREVGVRPVSRQAVLSTSEIVTIHLRLSDRTVGLIGPDELRQMRPSAYLVNTSRGPIVDEAALVDALRDGTIAGAGIDVFNEEPLALDHPLRSLDNVVLTPHMGYVTPRTYEVFYQDAVENIAAYLDGRITRPLEANPTDPYWWDV